MKKWYFLIFLNLVAIATGIFILNDVYYKHLKQDENNYVKMQELTTRLEALTVRTETLEKYNREANEDWPSKNQVIYPLDNVQ
jgi:uncharacterized protein YxeA